MSWGKNTIYLYIYKDVLTKVYKDYNISTNKNPLILYNIHLMNVSTLKD